MLFKKLFFFSVFLMIFTRCYSSCDDVGTVHLSLQSEKWVKTDTARVIVSFYGITNSADLNYIYSGIYDKLSAICKDTEWHITSFVRNTDSSGLENVSITSEARIQSKALADLKDNAKKVSKPGAKFEITDIQFTPSLADIERVRTSLRNEIYESVKDEIASLNKTYDDKYKVYKIDFDLIEPVPLTDMSFVRANAFQTTTNAFQVAGGAKSVQNVDVSTKLLMKADVFLQNPSDNICKIKNS